jgi:hypothetical protein
MSDPLITRFGREANGRGPSRHGEAPRVGAKAPPRRPLAKRGPAQGQEQALRLSRVPCRPRAPVPGPRG